MAPVRQAQSTLFDLTEPWELHWIGMPEFIQKDLAPVATTDVDFEDGRLYVHHASLEDKAEFTRLLSGALAGSTPAEHGRGWFSELIGQDVSRGLAASDRKRTQSIWWPEAEIGRFAGKAYVDRETLSEPERALERDGVVDVR
jgi:hypothetical protein